MSNYKKISFKQKTDFNRIAPDQFVLPVSDYFLGGSVPNGITEIQNPIQGEIYYFEDENQDRPAVLLYVGERGNVITALEADGRGTTGNPTNASYTFNATITTNLESAFNTLNGLGEDVYLHIYNGNNVGSFLIDAIDTIANTITINSSEPQFVTDSVNIEWSVRDTETFTWIDLAKPEDYLNLNQYQPLLSSTNQLPLSAIDFPLNATEITNLSTDKLASGAEPWDSNQIQIANLESTQNQILARVELNDLATPATSIFSAGNITLQTALEQIDDAVLAQGRDNYIVDNGFNFGIQVGAADYLNDAVNDIVPTLQIGGSRNSSIGLRTGVLFMNAWDTTGAYPFIRADRDVNTFSSRTEPDYTWYPYTNTGIFSTEQNNISFTLTGNKTASLDKNVDGNQLSMFYIDGSNNDILGLRLNLIENATTIHHNYNNTFEFKLSDGGITNEIPLFKITADDTDNWHTQLLNIFPWIEFRNDGKIITDQSLIRINNTGGVPGIYLFDELGDQYGALQASQDVSGEVNLIASKQLNLVAENQPRVRLDTFETNALDTQEVSVTGATLYINQNAPVTYNSIDYYDYLVVDSSVINQFEVDDFLVAEESVSGGTDIKRYFYDSPGAGRYVQAIDSANSRVLLKKYRNGLPNQISSNLDRLVLNKVTPVPGNSRLLVQGSDPNTGDTILIGGMRQIPFEDFSLFSEIGRQIYISPEGNDLFRFRSTLDSTNTYALPLFELTDANKLRLGYLTTTVDGDLAMSAFGNRVMIFGREGYLMFNKDNSELTTFEISGTEDISQGNFRISLYGSKGNAELYSTDKDGTIRFRNSIVYKRKIIDVTGSTIQDVVDPQPDPVADNPLPIKPFKDITIPTGPDETAYAFVKRSAYKQKRFSYY